MVSQTVEVYGRLDYAHNNAGIEGDRAFSADCHEENWDRVIGINLKGVWLCRLRMLQALSCKDFLSKHRIPIDPTTDCLNRSFPLKTL